MTQVRVLVVDLEPALVDDADSAVNMPLGIGAKTVRAAIDRNIAVLRKLGYEADFCGTDEGKTAPDVLLEMMRAKCYDCLVMSARIRLVVRHSRLLERLLNLAQVTKPDTVIVFDTSPADTVETVRRWFPSSDVT